MDPPTDMSLAHAPIQLSQCRRLHPRICRIKTRMGSTREWTADTVKAVKTRFTMPSLVSREETNLHLQLPQ